jgi:predicted ATPase
MTPPHYVLTGGPCAGKTTTIDELARRGYDVSPEPGRMYLERKLKEGKTIEEIFSDISKVEQDLLHEYVDVENANKKDGVMFFDRGIPDCLAYYRIYGVAEDKELREAVSAPKYKKVFLLEMIDTFSNDEVRVESPEKAKRIHEEIRRAYMELGHTIIDVPLKTVEERVDFILANL